MMRASILVGVLLAPLGCKVADLDHCEWRGRHGFCAANFPEAPYCSPCAAVDADNGCVATLPSETACPELEPPETEGSEASSSPATETTAVTTDGSSSPATEGSEGTSSGSSSG